MSTGVGFLLSTLWIDMDWCFEGCVKVILERLRKTLRDYARDYIMHYHVAWWSVLAVNSAFNQPQATGPCDKTGKDQGTGFL